MKQCYKGCAMCSPANMLFHLQVLLDCRVSCMQSPHLLESLAPKVTSLSQADPEILGNSKVCLHYSLASHKLGNATTFKTTSCNTEHRKMLL